MIYNLFYSQNNINILKKIINDDLNSKYKLNTNINQQLTTCMDYVKKNVSDTRESPAIEILRRLLNLNAQVSYSDEYVRKIKINTSDQEKELETVEDYLTKISNSDLTILITDHDYFNIAEISSQSNLLIDTRGIVEIDNTKFFRG